MHLDEGEAELQKLLLTSVGHVKDTGVVTTSESWGREGVRGGESAFPSN